MRGGTSSHRARVRRARSGAERALADLAEEFGDGNLRATIMQNMILVNVPNARTRDLVHRPACARRVAVAAAAALLGFMTAALAAPHAPDEPPASPPASNTGIEDGTHAESGTNAAARPKSRMSPSISTPVRPFG